LRPAVLRSVTERSLPAPVSVGLIDGRVRNGNLLRFSPTEMDLSLEASSHGEEVFVADFGAAPERLETWRGVGCAACGNSGYRGRLGLHELLATSDDTRRAIARRAPVERSGVSREPPGCARCSRTASRRRSPARPT